MRVRAVARNLRLAPRKVRLVLEQLRGKPVEEALALLRYLPSPSAREVAKVVKSAAANAENNYAMAAGQLRIVAAYADDALRLKRFKAAARGRAAPRVRRHSHVTIVVDEEER